MTAFAHDRTVYLPARENKLVGRTIFANLFFKPNTTDQCLSTVHGVATIEYATGWFDFFNVLFT